MRAFAFVALFALLAVAATATEDQLPLANFASPNVHVYESNAALAAALPGKNSVVCFYNSR